MSPEDRCFIGPYAHSMGGRCHHQAGRPAEAIASFERAEALVERLGTAKGLSVVQQIEELRVRGRCLDTLGRGEQAAVYLERAVALAIEDATADTAWEEGKEDFAALDVAEVQTELVELLDRSGASARAAPEHRIHAFLFQAYGFAEQDRPDEAVRWFERAEPPEEVEKREPHPSRRIVMIAARAIMGAFARADRPEEAVAWYLRVLGAYSDGMMLGPAKRDGERAGALLALRENGSPFEFTLEKQLRGVMRGVHRFLEKIEAWGSVASGEPGDPEDELDDDEDDEDDGARAPESRG